MFELKINPGKNAILCVLKGRFDEDEARDYVEKFKQGVDQLQNDIIVITDLTDFMPTDDAVRKLLSEGTAYALERGVSRGIRVVDETVGSQVGNIQMNRTARQLGYEVEVVGSLEAAKQLLGW